nr:transcription termination factor Rho [Cellulosimicrobium arenosum]
MRLPELQALASQLGVKGTSKMRKSDLVDVIRGRTGEQAAPARPAGDADGARLEKPSRARSRRADRPASNASEPVREHAPAAASEQRGTTPVLDLPARADDARGEGRESNGRSEERGDQQHHDQQGRDQQGRDQQGRDQQKRGQRDSRAEAAAAVAEALGGQGARREGDTTSYESSGDRAARAAAAVGQVSGDKGSRRGERTDAAAADDRSDRGGRGQQRQGDQGQRADREDRQGSDRQDRQGGDRQDRQGQSGQGGASDRDEERGGRRRRGRDRGRDRKRGRTTGRQGPDVASLDEIELNDDDVLLPVAGILDILDNYAFVRTSGYLPGPNDVYVSLGQVKKSGLRRGDAITGAVRQSRDGDNGGSSQRQKFNALVRLDTVNGMAPDAAGRRADFTKLTPLYPQERLRLENEEATRLTPRVIDIVAPIGKGQRGLIVAPPKAGKTIIMQQIANAITTNNPEVHLMVVLVDERPEEVTDMERTVKGEVIASTFDRPASDHTIVAELAIERAKRLVELGQDVVVLLDSLTRLSRAYNLAAPASGRILSGGVDASALYPPKRFFGAARNIENGGSLTILASALVETGSKMDEVIFEEFKGTGNMELRLSRNLADKRIFPAVDVNASGTRREEVLLSQDELRIVYKLRRVMGALDQQQAIELLLGKLKDTKSNAEFLLQVQKTTPASFADENAGRTI